MKFSMLPVIDDSCTVLILGSLPGEKSLQMQEYYAHPQNQFWRIMCSVLGEPMPGDYEGKKQMLLRHNVALWDMVHSAERENSSLDSRIKDEVPNDIGGLLAGHNKIGRVVLNGGKAGGLFKKYFRLPDVEAFYAPSTSPAYAGMRIEEKTELWRRALLGEK